MTELGEETLALVREMTRNTLRNLNREDTVNTSDRVQIQQLRLNAIKRRLDRANARYMGTSFAPYFVLLALGVAALAYCTPIVWGFAAAFGAAAIGDTGLFPVAVVIALWFLGVPAVAFTAALVGEVNDEHMRQEVVRLQQQVRDEERRLQSYVAML